MQAAKFAAPLAPPQAPEREEGERERDRDGHESDDGDHYDRALPQYAVQRVDEPRQ